MVIKPGILERVNALKDKSNKDIIAAEYTDKYIVYPGEISWWEISDPKMRKLALNVQWKRVWRKTHKDITYQQQVSWRSCNPSVGTSKVRAITTYLPAPYKRSKPYCCELCGSLSNNLGWHHWDNNNASMGIWVCFNCNVFAEALDNTPEILSKYQSLVKDTISSDNFDANLRVCTRIDGKVITVMTPYKRSRPVDNKCELCSTSECYYYHHWEDTNTNRGIWICGRCHQFAEKLDKNGIELVIKYLKMKDQETNRVSKIIEGVSNVSSK